MGSAISVKDIRKNFGTVEALRGVSLEVDDGQKVVVIGPSGSGKSVLIRCINGLETPDSGSITVEGMDLADRHVNARASPATWPWCSRATTSTRTRRCWRT